MGKDTPRYFIDAKGSYYWQPSSELRTEGWPAEPLGKERGPAVARAIELNGELDAWRKAGRPARGASTHPNSPTPRRAGASIPGSCNDLFDRYQGRNGHKADRKYPTNAKTKRQYDAAIEHGRKWIGPLPAKKITPRIAEHHYLELAKKTPAQAAAIMRVLRRCFNRSRFLVDPGTPLYIAAGANPFLSLDLKGSQSEGRLWTRQERDAMVNAAFTSNTANYPSIGVAIELNWWLGQREGDVIALPPNALEGETLTIRQNKTFRRVHLPVAILPKVHELFARALEIQRARGVVSLTHLLVNEDTGKPWDEHAFRKAFRKVREAARCSEDLQFMYLRHTAVVETEDAGGTIPEIAGLTGHSLQTVTTLLERYGRRTRVQAENAIKKRLQREEREDAGG